VRWVLRSKIHHASVTEADLDYVGSLTVDHDLILKAGFWPGEKVSVVNVTNGHRIETYLFSGEAGSGVICANGAAAHKITKGDKIIIIGYELTDKPIAAQAILVDEKNKFIRML